MFIAAVNGAVDNKLTMNKSKEEAPFDYNYGISFFFAVLSFLTQELNGICNIYWYVDYYRKYKYDASEKPSGSLSVFQIPTIKVNDVITEEGSNAAAAAAAASAAAAAGKIHQGSGDITSVEPPILNHLAQPPKARLFINAMQQQQQQQQSKVFKNSN